jgi:hypothetical protein
VAVDEVKLSRALERFGESEWTADTALAVLLKDLKATYNEGLQQNVSLPFNALSSTQLFNSMGKEKPEAK